MARDFKVSSSFKPAARRRGRWIPAFARTGPGLRRGDEIWKISTFYETIKEEGGGMKEIAKEAQKFVPANAGQAKPKRILMADDNKAIRDMVSGCLEFMGYEVDLAIDGIEALAVFLKAPFDLVLTDYEMPAMDGLRLAGHIKARSPRTPVILLTGADRENVLKRVGKGLVDSVIFKPFLLENFEKTVQGVLTSSEQEDESAGAGQLLDFFRESLRIAQRL